MVRFATMDDYQWIYDLVDEVFPIAHLSRSQTTLEEQILANRVIVETDEHSVASFVPYDDYLDILLNITNPSYGGQAGTSSVVLSTYLLHKYRLPFRFYRLKETADAYLATRSKYVQAHTELLGEEEIEGNTWNLYEYTYGGL